MIYSFSAFANFSGSSGDTMSNLPAGVHNIIFKFIPTKFSDTYIVLKKCQFEIKHTGTYISK